MARAYEDDLRRKIFEAQAKGHGSFRTLAAVFGVSLGCREDLPSAAGERTARAGALQARTEEPSNSGSVRPDRHSGRGASGSDGSRVTRTTRPRHRRNDELVDGPAVVRTVGCAAEKKSLHAVERDTEANRKRREEFLERIRAIPPERLIYLDESGVTTSLTRRYGRGVGGRRIHEATPGGHHRPTPTNHRSRRSSLVQAPLRNITVTVILL
jgi:hypothetical protein